MVEGKIGEFVVAAERSGGVCSDYMRKLSVCERKEDLYRVLCDVNGGEWLFEKHAKNVSLPLDDFCKEYHNFLDGKRTMEYPDGYTSKMYCRHDGVEIVADTTLLWLLECRDVTVMVPKNAFPTIVLSRGSSATVDMTEGFKANVERYGDSKFNTVGGADKVTQKTHYL